MSSQQPRPSSILRFSCKENTQSLQHTNPRGRCCQPMWWPAPYWLADDINKSPDVIDKSPDVIDKSKLTQLHLNTWPRKFNFTHQGDEIINDKLGKMVTASHRQWWGVKSVSKRRLQPGSRQWMFDWRLLNWASFRRLYIGDYQCSAVMKQTAGILLRY
jgi:hypothetical protein